MADVKLDPIPPDPPPDPPPAADTVTPGPDAVPGTPPTLASQGEPWDTIEKTLKNPAGIPDLPPDLPPDAPIYRGV